ncbi:acyltransferase [Enterobacteriaceae bacterium BIT-l23]|uniref:acyltransferase family protein n=1 Tax=Jejubacter sp. L23 TaxID=3092086 RepID=UPI001585CB29|nr:acyltransferase [Enterobacteriaceae bacterium BIT-l23]
MNNKSIEILQLLRAVAAIIVVMNHLLAESFGGVFKYIGGYGVNIFFVISGFIMTYTAINKNPFEFIVDRVIRIYPPYIISSFALISISVFAFHKDLYFIIGNIFLLPGSDDGYRLANPVAWTLVYEMYFYIVFAFVLMVMPSRKYAAVVCAMLLCSSVLLIKYFYPFTGKYNSLALHNIVQSYMIIQFAAGCVIGVYFDSISRFNMSQYTFIALSMILSVACFALIDLLPESDVSRYDIFYPFSILVVALSLTVRECSFTKLIYIGNASYSIYLTHPYFNIALSRLDLLDSKAITILAVIASITAGVAFSKMVEIPLTKYLKRKKAMRYITN